MSMDKSFRVRCAESDWAEWQADATAQGISVSEYIRRAVVASRTELRASCCDAKDCGHGVPTPTGQAVLEAQLEQRDAHRPDPELASQTIRRCRHDRQGWCPVCDR